MTVIDLNEWAGRMTAINARPPRGAPLGGKRAGDGLIHIGGIARRVVRNLRS